MTITSTVLYILFILAFIIHDREEITMVHRWMLAHGDALCEKHPRFRRVLNHMRQMSTQAFAIAVLEELIMLVAITVYVIWGGPYAIEIWSAVFMAFSIHLIIHIGQAIVVRGYVPGLATSVLLLPFAYLRMQAICNSFSMMQLLLLGAVGLIVIAANLAFAHWLGNKIAK